MSLEGTCHCGDVKVSIPDDALGVVGCHCGDCQKLHGNYFAMLAVDRGALRVTGEVRWYDSSAKARRSFCGRCGSRLVKDPHGSPKVLVSAGLFDRHLPRHLIENVLPESKPDWYALPEARP